MNTVHDKTSRDPVDLLAAKVLHSKGVKTDRLKGLPSYHYHDRNPPRIFGAFNLKLRLGRQGVDLTGRRVGRLTVVGMVDSFKMGWPPKEKFGARWAVRCDCGMYEVRLAKSIKNENNQKQFCADCGSIEFSKQHYAYLRNQRK